MRLPGPRPEDGAADLEGARRHDPRRAEGGGRAGAAALARRPRREERGEDPEGARRGAEGPARVEAAARRRAARPARARRGAARAPGRGEGLRGRLGAPPPRDVPRPRRDRDLDRPAGADRALHDAATNVAERRREGRHEGDRDHERGPPARPARRAAGVVRQPAPALHRLEGAQRRAARGRGPARLLRLRVLGHEHRDRRGVHAPPTRRSSTPTSATRTSRPSCARTAASWRRRGRASCRCSSSGPTCAATCTATRPGRTGRRRSSRWRVAAQALGHEYLAICDHSHRLRDGRLAAAVGGDRRAQRAPRAVPDPEGDRGEHPRQRRARRRRRAARAARLGDGVGARELRQGSDRARARTRCRARTSTASAT